MKLYNRQEKNQIIAQAFTQELAALIEQDYLVDEPDSVGLTLYSPGGSALRLSREENSASVWDTGSSRRRKLKNFAPFGRYYIQEEDFNRLVLPRRRARQAKNIFLRKRRELEKAALVEARTIPDSFLERVRKEKGFKRADRENLRIYKTIYAYTTTYYMNCGTRAVLVWETNGGLALVNWLDKEGFDHRYQGLMAV